MMLLVMTLVTGIIYPLVVTAFAEVFFHDQANGSLVYHQGKPIGSVLIGQSFQDPKHFWSRPSATSPAPYNASASSGSNLGPSNGDLVKQVEARIQSLKEADPDNTRPVPVDLVTSSASGLDPHISLAAAYYQAPRIARVHGWPKEAVDKMIRENTEDRFVGIIGEPVVNVLKLNLALDFPRQEIRLPGYHQDELPEYMKYGN